MTGSVTVENGGTAMAEYIDRALAKEEVKHIPWCNYSAVGACLDQLPSADVEVVKHGRWERLPDNEEWAYCSQCHCCWEWEIINNCNVRYCPNCGAKMDLEG